MMWFLTAGGAVLALVVAVSAAALVEVFRQLADVRIALNLQDEPAPLGLKTGELRTDEIGLPREIAIEPKAIVVFLSPRCATCLAIAESFRSGSPETAWFVLTGSRVSGTAPLAPPTDSRVTETLIDILADSVKRVIIDENDAISDRIGLHVTPSVFTSSYGEITRAYGVSTPRQMQKLIPMTVGRNLTHPTSAGPRSASQESTHEFG
jgi:hypothetical protein